MRKLLIIIGSILMFCQAEAQVGSRCAVCPPTLRGVPDGYVLTDSSGNARWQAGSAATLTLEQGLNKVGSAARLGGALNRGDATIQMGTNQVIFANDSTLPADNAQVVKLNSGDGTAINGGTQSDSLNTTFTHSNTAISSVMTSNSTGVEVSHNIDSNSSVDKVRVGDLDYQQGVYVNPTGGDNGNFTTEMNIYSPSLVRDINFLGIHYGHWQYFISDTLSGSSYFPQGHGVFAIDSFAIATHVTEKPTSEYASKFATKLLVDTAYKFMVDSNETPIVSIHRNGIKIVGGTQGVGKVLTSSASGLASWGALNVATYNLSSYVNDAAADADTGLPSGGLYKLNASRAIYQKP